jgi:hypothetical protein
MLEKYLGNVGNMLEKCVQCTQTFTCNPIHTLREDGAQTHQGKSVRKWDPLKIDIYLENIGVTSSEEICNLIDNVDGDNLQSAINIVTNVIQHRLVSAAKLTFGTKL